MYTMYSKYYDRLNDSYDYWINFINTKINFAQNNASMVEYGCGTGNILLRYADRFALTGVDISPDMLSLAKAKLPQASFELADMTNYLNEDKYNVALCLFDSLNHVLDIKKWEEFFKNASISIKDNGIFILDINTVGRLRDKSMRPPICTEFDGNYMIMQVVDKGNSQFGFVVKIFKKRGDGLFELEEEEIVETACAGSDVFTMLTQNFSNVEAYNEKQELITSMDNDAFAKHRWFYVLYNDGIRLTVSPKYLWSTGLGQ